MLRFMFGEERRGNDESYAEATKLIRQYVAGVPSHINKKQRSEGIDATRLTLMAQGFIRSLDELEQSMYVCDHLCQEITSSSLEGMDQAERDNYHRFVYFYKNALIRIFAILDKLGGFMNEHYDLRTDKEKDHFSYYTVLRRMRSKRVADALEQSLFDLKLKYQDPMYRLKKARNLEIHAMNEELVDDLLRRPGAEETPVEDLRAKLADLHQGYDMVYEAFVTVFRYLGKGRG